MAEKTEKATPKKLRDARKKGQVAKSKDFPAAFTFIVSLAGVVIGASYMFQKLASYMIQTFRAIGPNLDLQNDAGPLILYAVQVINEVSLPLMVIVTVIGLLVNFIIIGPLFSMEALKPDIKKLNPVTNLKNLFKVKTFVELIKSIFKIAGAIIIIYFVLMDNINEIVETAGIPLLGSAIVFSHFLVQVAIRVGLFFIVIAIFDLVFQKLNFQKEMKMEKFEVKQEMKDTEGNPEIKGKRRQIAQEIAYSDGPRSVRRAKAVITNPVHIAVAIEYDETIDPAPKIVTMGKGAMAEEIMKVALEYQVPIMRNVELAQTLYEKGSISQYIPEETYQVVAEILRWIEQLEKTKEEHVLEFLK